MSVHVSAHFDVNSSVDYISSEESMNFGTRGALCDTRPVTVNRGLHSFDEGLY